MIEEKYVYARIQYLLSAMLVNHLIGHSQGTEYTLGYRGYKSMKLWSRNRQRDGQRRCQIACKLSGKLPKFHYSMFSNGKKLLFYGWFLKLKASFMAVGRYSTQQQVTHWSCVKVFYPPQLSHPTTRPPEKRGSSFARFLMDAPNRCMCGCGGTLFFP